MEYLAIVVIVLAGVISLSLYLSKFKPVNAWLLGFLIVPLFILVEEFVLPYQGGGASMWPLALFIGGFYGAISSSIGLILGKYLK
jgi:hypothetical protein